MVLYTSLEIQDEYVLMSYILICEEKKVHCDVFVWLFGKTNIYPNLLAQTSLAFQSTGSCILPLESVSLQLAVVSHSCTYLDSSFQFLVDLLSASKLIPFLIWYAATKQYKRQLWSKWFRKLDNERHPFRNPRRAIYDNACTGAKVAIQILSLFSLRSPSTALWWKHEENNLHLSQHLENFFVWESIQVHCSHFRASKDFNS